MRVAVSSYRKTRKGSIVRLVREHYLRDDIHCGLESCNPCKKFKLQPEDRFAPASYLSSQPRIGVSKLHPSAHYLVLDYSVVLNQSDLIADVAFGDDIIIMQTVWKDIKSNFSVFMKLKELLSSRRFYLFNNEHFRETFRLRNSDESIPKYKQNLALLATQWLQEHFNIPIIYLTNIGDNTIDSSNFSFKVIPIDLYVENLSEKVRLMDKLVNPSTDSSNSNENTFLYDEHLSLHEVQAQIKAGKLFKGKFRTSSYNYLEASVTINLNGEEMNVVIQGREHINRAINEDVVAIQLLPKSEWKLKPELILDEDAIEEDKEHEDGVGGEEETKLKETISDRPVGKVVSIIKRNWRSYCGVIKERHSSSTGVNFFFIPVDKRIPFVKIETRQYENLKGKKILVNVDCWPRDSKFPRGHYTRILGDACDKNTETDVLLLEHNVPHMEFSAQVLNCLPPEGENWKAKPEELVDRADFRDLYICSVDPPGCTDIDDALHCKDLGNNIYEVGVHIADVSHFVKPNTALDKEAADRGTTVYLVDRRIHMLPDLLSSNLCSLQENQERMSFSCVWQINAQTAEILSTKCMKSILKSKAALTYTEAQLKIDSADQDEISKSLRRLNALAKVLKAKRIEKGALVLASANEIRFSEAESETADNELVILEKKLLETNSMVEEFMLLANISVAQKIYDAFPEFAVLRRHPKPSQSNFEELIVAAKNRGFEIDVSNGKSLSESLNRAVDSKNEHLNLLLRMITTRCMSQAVYFCTGALSSDPSLTFAHYGLASEIYTHFTSPIRRYADLMVHRLLSHSIHFEHLEPQYLCKRKITDICEHINTRNMNARRASRSSNELHSYLYVRGSKKGFVEETGHIFTLKTNAIVIFVMHLAFEVVYHFKSAQDWIVDKEKATVLHTPTGTTLRQFDPVHIQLSIEEAITSSFKKQIAVKLVKPSIDAK